MKGRHLAAVAIALVAVSTILFFGLGGKHERAIAGADTSIPAKVEAAPLHAPREAAGPAASR